MVSRISLHNLQLVMVSRLSHHYLQLIMSSRISLYGLQLIMSSQWPHNCRPTSMNSPPLLVISRHSPLLVISRHPPLLVISPHGLPLVICHIMHLAGCPRRRTILLLPHDEQNVQQA